MEYECLIIFYQGDVVATQSSSPGQRAGPRPMANNAMR